MEKRKGKKKTLLAVALVACLALAGVMGVLAWYSSQSEITNTFTVGNIQPPTTDPTNPENKDPLKPDVDPSEGGHKGQVSGNIVEDAWIPDSRIVKGSTVPKNPNIGMSPQSDAAYVFVYVDNAIGTGTYFTLNENWKAVDGQATAQGTVPNAYTGGLFMYVGSPAGVDAAKLQPNAGGLDAWTGEVFSTVIAANDADIKSSPAMKVSAYLVADANKAENLSAAEALDAAKAWAAGLTKLPQA